MYSVSLTKCYSSCLLHSTFGRMAIRIYFGESISAMLFAFRDAIEQFSSGLFELCSTSTRFWLVFFFISICIQSQNAIGFWSETTFHTVECYGFLFEKEKRIKSENKVIQCLNDGSTYVVMLILYFFFFFCDLFGQKKSI